MERDEFAKILGYETDANNAAFQLKEAIDNLEGEGGTNYEAAFKKGFDMLDSATGD